MTQFQHNDPLDPHYKMESLAMVDISNADTLPASADAITHVVEGTPSVLLGAVAPEPTDCTPERVRDLQRRMSDVQNSAERRGYAALQSLSWGSPHTSPLFGDSPPKPTLAASDDYGPLEISDTEIEDENGEPAKTTTLETDANGLPRPPTTPVFNIETSSPLLVAESQSQQEPEPSASSGGYDGTFANTMVNSPINDTFISSSQWSDRQPPTPSPKTSPRPSPRHQQSSTPSQSQDVPSSQAQSSPLHPFALGDVSPGPIVTPQHNQLAIPARTPPALCRASKIKRDNELAACKNYAEFHGCELDKTTVQTVADSATLSVSYPTCIYAYTHGSRIFIPV